MECIFIRRNSIQLKWRTCWITSRPASHSGWASHAKNCAFLATLRQSVKRSKISQTISPSWWKTSCRDSCVKTKPNSWRRYLKQPLFIVFIWYFMYSPPFSLWLKFFTLRIINYLWIATVSMSSYILPTVYFLWFYSLKNSTNLHQIFRNNRIW